MVQVFRSETGGEEVEGKKGKRGRVGGKSEKEGANVTENPASDFLASKPPPLRPNIIVMILIAVILMMSRTLGHFGEVCRIKNNG